MCECISNKARSDKKMKKMIMKIGVNESERVLVKEGWDLNEVVKKGRRHLGR
jgi:hypothetical protein